MKDKLINLALLTMILASALYTAGTIGYTQGYGKASEAPASDFVDFTDYKSDYHLHKDTQYHTERITDITGTYYFVYYWYGENRGVVEYSDTVIDGQFTFAKHWKDSFILALKGE
jgi:hypothetical protein